MKRAKKSKLHELALVLLKKLYPTYQVLEEIKIPGTKLTLDIFLPQKMLALEIQGEQHVNFNGFFHRDLLDFGRQKVRDNQKVQFCELNNIKLVCLYWNEQQLWLDQLKNV